MATSDPVGTALASIGAAATTGAAVLSAGVLVLRTLQPDVPSAPATDPGPASAALLGAVVLLGLTAAAITCWVRSRAIDDPWRRAVAAGVSVFATALLTLATAPVDMLLGRIGIAAYLLIMTGVSVPLHRAARRAAAQ